MMKTQVLKNSYFTPVGSRISPEYKNIFDEDKKRNIVKKTGQFDIYEFIQASESQTDLSMLRQQMAATGQLPNVSDEVIDYSLFPEDIHELNNVVSSAESRFNALPESIKNVFGTKDKFIASLIKGTYEADIIHYYESVDNGKPKDTIKKDDSIKDGDIDE